MKLDLTNLNPHAICEALGAAVAAMEEIEKDARPIFKPIMQEWRGNLLSLLRRMADTANGKGEAE